jgi:hypothetical protein
MRTIIIRSGWHHYYRLITINDLWPKLPNVKDRPERSLVPRPKLRPLAFDHLEIPKSPSPDSFAFRCTIGDPLRSCLRRPRTPSAVHRQRLSAVRRRRPRLRPLCAGDAPAPSAGRRRSAVPGARLSSTLRASQFFTGNAAAGRRGSVGRASAHKVFFDPTISVESSGGRLRYGQFSGLGYDPLRIILYIYCLLSIWPFWRRRQCWCAWGVLGGSYAYLNLSVRLFILLLHRRSYSTRFRRSGKPGRYVLATPNMLIWQLSLHCYDFFLSV